MAEDDKWVGGGGGGSSGDSGGGSSVSGSSVSGSSSSSSASSASASGTDKPSGGEGSGAPQKSKTNLYEDLEPKLKAAFRTEWDGLRGDRPKRWFTSLMYKRTYKEIFDEFLAGPHDDNWTALTQDKHSSFSDIAVNARAIGYMDSMWRELNQLYMVDEINSATQHRNAVGKWLFMDPEILSFLKTK